MRGDSRKEVAFIVRFAITEAQFRRGVPVDAVEIPDDEDATELLGSPADSGEEVAAHVPGSELTE